MPIAPKPFKFQCPNCGYEKIVKLKSDALSPMDFMSTCPKCKSQMNRKELNALDEIVSIFK